MTGEGAAAVDEGTDDSCRTKSSPSAPILPCPLPPPRLPMQNSPQFERTTECEERELPLSSAACQQQRASSCPETVISVRSGVFVDSQPGSTSAPCVRTAAPRTDSSRLLLVPPLSATTVLVAEQPPPPLRCGPSATRASQSPCWRHSSQGNEERAFGPRIADPTAAVEEVARPRNHCCWHELAADN